MLTFAKREKAAEVANEDTKIATESFYNTLRGLKFQLRKSFYSLYFNQKTLEFYDVTIARLRAAVPLPKDLRADRSRSLKELLRFKTLFVTFENERLDILRQISELQGTLRTLLGGALGDSMVELIPILDERTLHARHISFSKEEAVQKAIASRQDLQIAQTRIKREQLNVSLQKLGWLPDFTLGAHYAKSGSFTEDYVGLTLSFDLPFVDHNQGYLQVAHATVQAQMRLRDLTRMRLENEVEIAYDNAQRTDALLTDIGPDYTKGLSDLVRETIRKYERKKIGVIEFTDFYEAHRTSIVQINALEAKRLAAFEELTYTIGAD